jgi:hypothetical protein
MQREDLIQMVVQRDFGGIDALPLGIKLTLLSRLADGIGIDLEHVKGLIWHPDQDDYGLPTLGSSARYSDDGVQPSPSNGRFHPEPERFVPAEKPNSAIPLKTTLETPPA